MSKSFTDAAGRVWTPRVDCLTLRKFEDQTGIGIGNLADVQIHQKSWPHAFAQLPRPARKAIPPSPLMTFAAQSKTKRSS